VGRQRKGGLAAVCKPPRVEDEEVDAVLAALECRALHPIVALALASGMRRGELLGLQWGDVDLDAGTLRVERSLEETKAGLRLKPPKMKRGRRKIALGASAVALLRAHKVQQMEYRFAVGMGKLEDNSPVFCNHEGQMIRPRNLTKAWSRTIDSLGLPKVKFHALRHTHISVLIAEGVNIFTISRRIGHSKTSVALDTYSRLMPRADEAAAAAIEEALK
jgi:integrase